MAVSVKLNDYVYVCVHIWFALVFASFRGNEGRILMILLMLVLMITV